MIGLRRLIAVSIPTLMFCIGAVKMLRHFNPFGYGKRLEDILEAPQISITLFWLLLMLLPLSLLVLKIKGSVGRKLLELRTESGSKLNVREKAVNRYVQDCLDSMSFVRDVRVKTKTNRGALEMSIRVWVAATQKLDSLQQRIVDTVTDDLKRGFGIARIVEPKIIIESVKTARRRTGSESRREQKKKEESEPYLSEDVAALSAPETMTEKEVLEYAPLESAEEESKTEDQAEDFAPSDSFFGRNSSDETAASQENKAQRKEDKTGEEEK
ncbi:MAG: hypothetical protein ACOC2L_03025 [Candidatus Sumerlaeota bacterium]